MDTGIVDLGSDSVYGIRLPPLKRMDLEETPTSPKQISPRRDVVDGNIVYGQTLPSIVTADSGATENIEGAAYHSEGPRIVYMKIVFMKIGEIDTVKEHFEADIFLQARWREKSLDHGRDKWRELSSTHDKVEYRNMDLNKYWQPKILIQNAMTNSRIKTWSEIQYGKVGEAFIVEKSRVKGTFTENLELHDFPFDSQELGVVITSELSNKEVEIQQDDDEVSMINLSCFVDEQEWTLKNFVESVARDNVKEFTESKKEIHSGLCMQCVATRKSGFFVWNIIVIMTIISSLSFATFSVSRKLPQSRLQLSFTLTLTGVAFRFVTNQSLPKISYLTLLDQYILFSMIFNYLVSAWHAVVTLYEDHTDQDMMDFWAFIAFIILYSLFLLIFILVVSIKMLWKHRNASNKEQQYNDKAIKILGDSWTSRRLNRSRRRVGPINLPF